MAMRSSGMRLAGQCAGFAVVLALAIVCGGCADHHQSLGPRPRCSHRKKVQQTRPFMPLRG